MNKGFLEEDIKKVAKGAGTTLIGSSIGKGLFFLTQVIIAKLLGVEAFGLFSLGFAVIKICEIIARLGLNTGGMRFVSIYRTESASKLKGILLLAVGISLLNGVLIGLILYYFSDTIALKIFHKKGLFEPLKLFAMSIPFLAGLTVVSSLLQGFHTTKYTVYIRDFIQPVMNIFLITVFHYSGYGLQGVIYAFIFSHAISLILGFYYYTKLIPEFEKRDIKPDYELKSLLLYSVPLLFVGFLHYFLAWTDTLMLGLLGSTNDIGIYRAASQVPFIMTLFLAATNSIYAPIAADLYQRGEMQRLASILKTTTRWVAYITIPIFVILLVSAKEIMMLFGSGYVETGYIVLIILSFGQLIHCVTGGTGVTLTMTSRQNLELFNSLSMVCINVILNYQLIPNYGAAGAAISNCFSIVIINIMRVVEIKLMYKMHPFTKSVIKYNLPFLFSITLLVFLGRINTQLEYMTLLIMKICIVLSLFVGYFILCRDLNGEDAFIFKKIKNILEKPM